MTNIPEKNVTEVVVEKITHRGLWAKEPSLGQSGWLPASEWSYDPADWNRDRGRIKQGHKLHVVRWGRSLAGGYIALSRRRVDHDPWSSVDESWIGQIHFFTVSRLTRNNAIGELQPGLQARIDSHAFFRYLSAKLIGDLWDSHKIIALGDLVGGVVKEIRRPDENVEPEIVLDAEKLLFLLEDDPTLLATKNLIAFSPSAPEIAKTPPDLSSLDIDHVMVVDNDREFAAGVAQTLTAWGFRVDIAYSERDAVQLSQSMEPDALQLALVDVHLLQADGVHDGLSVSKAVRDRHSHCKIIIVSGEELGPEHREGLVGKARDAGDLKVSAYLAKPFTIQELQSEIAVALHAQERDLGSIISELLADPQSLPLVSPATPKIAEGGSASYRYSLIQAVAELGSILDSVVVHIFEMDPIDFRGRSIAHSGEGLGWESIRHKLGKSPVKDTAVSRGRGAWVDSDVMVSPRLRGRHFWLLEAMNYRSALGIPIKATSPLAYCLIALHPKPGAFSSEFILKAELCAERAARALEWEWIMKQSSERARFEKAGMGFGFLAHELRTILTTLDADAYNLTDMLISAESNQGELLALAGALKKSSERAVQAARTLTGVKGSGVRERINLFECVETAVRAAVLQIPDSADITMSTPPIPEAVYVSRGDRSSLILAVFNLLLNAVQQVSLYPRPKGLIWVSWRTVTDRTGPWIALDFNDTGPGIHAANQKRIFEMGFTTRPEGTGMGLHICREIVESITAEGRKGSIEVSRSVLNVGTTFTMYLPFRGQSR